jgi:hypothetical protein
MLTVAVIQFLDACFDIADSRWTVLRGVMLIGALLAVTASRLLKQPAT